MRLIRNIQATKCLVVRRLISHECMNLIIHSDKLSQGTYLQSLLSSGRMALWHLKCLMTPN